MCVSSGNTEPSTLNFQGKEKATSQEDIQGQLEVNCLLLYSANRMENDIYTLSEEKGFLLQITPYHFPGEKFRNSSFCFILITM